MLHEHVWMYLSYMYAHVSMHVQIYESIHVWAISNVEIPRTVPKMIVFDRETMLSEAVQDCEATKSFISKSTETNQFHWKQLSIQPLIKHHNTWPVSWLSTSMVGSWISILNPLTLPPYVPEIPMAEEKASLMLDIKQKWHALISHMF